MFCSQCGKTNKDDARYCAGCGANLETRQPPAEDHASIAFDTLSGQSTATTGQFAGNQDEGWAAGSGGVLESGVVVAGRFKILQRLGGGGMGHVYRVHDLQLNRERAMKVIRPDLLAKPGMLERFYDEVDICQMLTHSHIVRVHDCGQDEARGVHFFTMEYLSTISLRVWLTDKKGLGTPVTLEQLCVLAKALCEAMSYAHHFTVHRDLKPENILVSADLSVVKVTDFGIAKLLGDLDLTATRTGAGTPYYMAPEQRYKGKTDRGADIYSLAVILYEILVGHTPSGAERVIDIRPDIPAPVSDAIARAMAHDPARRYETMAAFWSALEQAATPFRDERLPRGSGADASGLRDSTLAASVSQLDRIRHAQFAKAMARLEELRAEATVDFQVSSAQSSNQE
jgi:serine/threonine protein kinase